MALRVAYTLEQCWHRVPGGTASSALGAARALSARDDVELYGVSAWHRNDPQPPWVPPIPVRRIALPRPLLYETWHRLRLPRVPGRPDVIHATGMAIPGKSAPLAVTVHDLAFLTTTGLGTAHGQRFFERSWELTLRDADLVLTPSQATKRDCVAHGFPEARVRVVPWGVDLPVRASRVDGRAKHGLAERFVLAVGTIEPRKNLPALLQAFQRLDDHRVQLVIAGPEGWNESLAPHIGSARDRVRLLGFLPEAELHSLYSQATVFCYPSRQEGFGIPVLEAMAHGAAVVTSRGTSTEEVAGDAALLIDPDSVDDIAQAVERLLTDRELAARLGAAARARAADFSWARTAELTTAAYREVSA